jgi:hypothetical protein
MQLARNCGATVATTASAAGADLLKAHGADIIGKTTSREFCQASTSKSAIVVCSRMLKWQSIASRRCHVARAARLLRGAVFRSDTTSIIGRFRSSTSIGDCSICSRFGVRSSTRRHSNGPEKAFYGRAVFANEELLQALKQLLGHSGC